LRDNVQSDSEGSDDEVRDKVKSAQVKRLDELETSIKQIENGQKNGDWTLISNGMAAVTIREWANSSANDSSG
jgi:translation initiation factor 3 subunit C